MTKYFILVPSCWIFPSLSFDLQIITHAKEGRLRKLKVTRYRTHYLTEKRISNKLSGNYKPRGINLCSICLGMLFLQIPP